jgi:hypothetical protein
MPNTTVAATVKLGPEVCVPEMLLHEEIVVRAAVAYSGEMIRIEELCCRRRQQENWPYGYVPAVYAAQTWLRYSSRSFRRQRSWDMKSLARVVG